MKRAVPFEKTRNEYIQGIQEFMPLPATVMTFTFRTKRSYRSVRRSLLRFERAANEHCFGRRFRKNGKRLRIVAVIEGRRTARHIHLIVEQRPELDEPSVKRLWKTNVCRSTSIKAIKVKPVYYLPGLANYLTKEVRWGEVETEPYFFGPKKTDDNQTGSSHE